MTESEYDVLQVENPFLNISESANDKIGILDVKLKTTSGNIIDIEIQVARMKYMRERILYYLLKMTSDQIGTGEDYGKIKKVISIIISADHILIDENDKQHNKYFFHDPITGSIFTDKMEINTLDLMKNPDKNTDNPDLQKWVELFNADTEEELEMIHNSPDPAIKKAVDIVISVNQDKDLRVQAEQRENAVRAFKSEIEGSKQDGIAEGMKKGMENGKIEIAKNLLKMGLPIEQVAKGTELTIEQIKKIECEVKQ